MMPEPSFWLSVAQIICIDVLLSGDNAIVIAMACRGLPKRQRFLGISIGVAAAFLLRIICVMCLATLLTLPGVKMVGGIALLWIAVNLVLEEDGDEEDKTHHARGLLYAIGMLVWADITMSFDNIVAIAAASKGNVLVFNVGLLVSMPLMIVGASLITALIARFPIIVWAGGALLGWIAGAMIVEDPLLANVQLQLPPTVQAALVGAMLVVVAAAAWPKKTASSSAVHDDMQSSGGRSN
jgi:YjbE family integral membrane protein